MSISIEKLKAVRHIIVHEGCPDGIASAMILLSVYPDADVQFVQYSSKEHNNLPATEGMIFADFSPSPDRVEAFIDAKSIVLDHHKTARPVVEAFGDLGVFGDEETDPGVSGAVLAFREVWLPMVNSPALRPVIEDFATLAGIRDTWQTKNPRWKEACEQAQALKFWPTDMILKFAPSQWTEKLSLGPILFEKQLKHARKAADNAYRFTTSKGTKVVVFQGIWPTSDAAEYLGETVDVVIGFTHYINNGEPTMRFSIRSHTDFDCGAFAKVYPGGGGHTKSSGFMFALRAEDPNPFAMARREVERFEAVAALGGTLRRSKV
jgi:hypothetical protein